MRDSVPVEGKFEKYNDAYKLRIEPDLNLKLVYDLCYKSLHVSIQTDSHILGGGGEQIKIVKGPQTYGGK